MKIPKFILSLSFFLVPFLGHAYEQDNWYLHGPIDGNLSGVFHQEYNATSKRDMLYKTATGVGLEVRDINGSLLQTINTGGITFTDIEFDQNASRLFGINASKLTCFEQNASGGWSEQWRSTQSVSTMTQGPSGNLFCANNGNKIYVFEQNGTMSNEFGWVDGINSLSNNANVVGFLPNAQLVVLAKYKVIGGVTDIRHFIFKEDCSLTLNPLRVGGNWRDENYSRAVPNGQPSKDGIISYRFKRQYYDSSWSNLIYSPFSATITNPGILVSLWLQNGDFISGSNLYRRTFRTKMETNHNSVPQPVIHRIAQRTGTNVLELDFEVIDTDDDNVTVGILAYCGSDKLVPQAWLNGTGSKIGTPIATNTVHSMEWDAKQDWSDSTGAIKFEILCQDGSRTKPVDLHFLTLPFSDGNMTISRSPLKDSDFLNYAKFLLATGQAQFESNTSNAVVLPGDSNTTIPFTFTNCGASGRSGPSVSQINSTYAGTSLDGNVTAGWKAGYQKWIVPVTGHYWIEAYGARGGNSNQSGGGGTYLKGKLLLSSGDELNIAIGEAGGDYSKGGSGGGGTFVVKDNNNTPLIIAGGGGGAGESSSASLLVSNLTNGFNGTKQGGSNGAGGSGAGSGGGGGFSGNGSSWYTNQGGFSYQEGLNGGDSKYTGQDGGFGGGGATHVNFWRDGGGGGGYSGGGGSENGDAGGGGGSFNSGALQSITPGLNDGHGKVEIRPIQTVRIIDGNWNVLSECKEKLLKSLGSNYRFATSADVTKAREAATPGAVNNWTASNQVKPRNLPGKVNEYGFDVSTTSGFWVIKE